MSQKLPQILMVQRAERFSPHAVEKDVAVLHAVGDCLSRRGAQVDYIAEEQLSADSFAPGCDVVAVFSMARSEAALNMLQQAEDSGYISADILRKACKQSSYGICKRT